MSSSEWPEPDAPIQDPHRTRPFHSGEQVAAIALVRAADSFRRWITKAIEPWDITLQQFNVLRILRGAGPDGLATLAVAERMVERTPGVTRLLDRLEENSLIERIRDTEDRRRVLARITPDGLALLDRVDEPFARAEEDAFGGLEPADLHRLAKYLGRVHEHLTELEDDDEAVEASPK